MASDSQRDWWVYIIRCSDDSLYTGVTVNLLRRWRQHHGLAGGAKYFRGRQPVEVVYVEANHCRRSASRREYSIKQMTRNAKIKLLADVEAALLRG